MTNEQRVAAALAKQAALFWTSAEYKHDARIVAESLAPAVVRAIEAERRARDTLEWFNDFGRDDTGEAALAALEEKK